MFVKRCETLPSSSTCCACVGFVFFLIPLITCKDAESSKLSLCPYVFGGTDAPQGRFPYMCSIRRTNDLEHACGGTLIKGRWLLTAAHCMDPEFASYTGEGSLVYCDIHRKNEYNESKTYAVDTIHVHGKWESKLEKGYDIALIKLDRVADVPVPMLPSQSHTYPIGGGYSVLGWGAAKPDKCTVDRLQIGIDLQAESNYHCSNDSVWGEKVTESMICAGGGSVDTAIGDSGGPFLQVDKPLGYVKDGDPSLDRVVGITSFGVGEGQRQKNEKPGVYTNVGFFRKWIDCVIEEKPPKRKCEDIPPEPEESVTPQSLPATSPKGKTSPSPDTKQCLRLKESEEGFNETDALKTMKEAIEIDDSDTVECILKDGLLDANATFLVINKLLPSHATSFLHHAAKYNAVESTEVLVDHEAEVDIRDGREQTPLHIAAEQGSLGVAKVLVREGAKLNVQSSRGDYPLHYAAYYGRESIVEFLAKEGADVNSKNVYEDTPLHIAAAKGFVSVVEVLVNNEASKVETKDSGETPFDVICQDLDEDMECNDETWARLEDLLSTD